jgi:hypothetical protein
MSPLWRDALILVVGYILSIILISAIIGLLFGPSTAGSLIGNMALFAPLSLPLGYLFGCYSRQNKEKDGISNTRHIIIFNMFIFLAYFVNDIANLIVQNHPSLENNKYLYLITLPDIFIACFLYFIFTPNPKNYKNNIH